MPGSERSKNSNREAHKIGNTAPKLPLKPDKPVPHHRAIEAAPQGVVADRHGSCDGDVPQAAPTRAREKNFQVEAVGVHRRGHTPVRGPKHGSRTLSL